MGAELFRGPLPRSDTRIALDLLLRCDETPIAPAVRGLLGHADPESGRHNTAAEALSRPRLRNSYLRTIHLVGLPNGAAHRWTHSREAYGSLSSQGHARIVH